MSFRKTPASAGDVSPIDVAWAAVLWLMGVSVFAVVMSDAALSLPTLIALAAIAGVAERRSVAFSGSNVELSVAFLPYVFAAVAGGPLAGLAVGAFANIGDLRRPYMRWTVYTPIRALTGAAAGFAASTVSTTDGEFMRILVAVLLASLACGLLDVILGLSTLCVRGIDPSRYLRATGPAFLLAVPFYVPFAAFLVYGYQTYSFWVVATIMIPTLALQQVVRLYQIQRQAARELAAANLRLERASVSFAGALVATLDARDRYTAGHSAAVAVYSRDIAAQLGLSASDQDTAFLAGLVHDIGKIGLPASLLEKAGPLTLAERRRMQEHSAIGARILAHVADYDEIAAIVRHHHERLDGNGYPDGQRGDSIPLISRIIAVADAYNAMTSHRPYREAMPTPIARNRLAQAAGSQFDEAVANAFEFVLADRDESYRYARGPEFQLASAGTDSTGIHPFTSEAQRVVQDPTAAVA